MDLIDKLDCYVKNKWKGELISYVKDEDKFKFRCKSSHIFMRSLDEIKNGTFCDTCNITNNMRGMLLPSRTSSVRGCYEAKRTCWAHRQCRS